MRLLWIFPVLLLIGCADPARNLYEGIKGANDAKRTPNERAVSPAPSYDTYQKELERLNK
jgi:hypothetical protein